MIKKYNEIIRMLIEEYISYYSGYSRKKIKNSLDNIKLEQFQKMIKELDLTERLSKERQSYFLSLLEKLEESLSRRGCNDFIMPAIFTNTELCKMNKEFHEINGDPEEYDETDDFSITMDFIILYYIHYKYVEYFKTIETADRIKKF